MQSMAKMIRPTMARVKVAQLACCAALFALAGRCSAETYYLKGSDGGSKSSFNWNGNGVGWSSTKGGAKKTFTQDEFKAADFIIDGSYMRTGENVGDQEFTGHSLRIVGDGINFANGGIVIKNTTGRTITFPHLNFENGVIIASTVASNPYAFTLAGDYTVQNGSSAVFLGDSASTRGFIVTAAVHGDETTKIRAVDLRFSASDFRDLGDFFGVFESGGAKDSVGAENNLTISGPFGGRIGQLTDNTTLRVNYDELPAGKGLRATCVSAALKTKLVLYGAKTDFLTDGLPLLRFPAGTEIDPADFKIVVASSADDAAGTTLALKTYVDADDSNAVVLAVSLAQPVYAKMKEKGAGVYGWRFYTADWTDVTDSCGLDAPTEDMHVYFDASDEFTAFAATGVQTFDLPVHLGSKDNAFTMTTVGPLALSDVRESVPKVAKAGVGELSVPDTLLYDTTNLTIGADTLKIGSRSSVPADEATITVDGYGNYSGVITIADGARLDVNQIPSRKEDLNETEMTHGKLIFVAGDGPDGKGAIYNSQDTGNWGATFSHIVLTGDASVGGGRMDLRPMSGSKAAPMSGVSTIEGASTLTIRNETNVFSVCDADFKLSRLKVSGKLLLAGNITGTVTNGIWLADGATQQFWSMGSSSAGIPFVVKDGATASMLFSNGDGALNGAVTVDANAVLTITTDKNATFTGAFTNEGAVVQTGASTLYLNGALSGNGSLSGAKIRFGGTANRWVLAANDEGFTSKVKIDGVTDAAFLDELKAIEVTYTGDKAAPRTFVICPQRSLTMPDVAVLSLIVRDEQGSKVANCRLGLEDGNLVLYLNHGQMVRTALWTGGGRADDPSDPGNWTCLDDDGEPMPGAVPFEMTSVLLPGETTFACPSGTEFKCMAVILQDTVLGEDLDWRGLDATRIARNGTIDLAGHNLHVALTASPVQTLTFTDSSAAGAGGALRLDVAEGVTAENATWAFAGTMKLVKEGEGTFVAKRKEQTYAGGTEILSGKLTVPMWDGKEGTWGGKAHLLGSQGSEIKVDAGGTFDIAGNYDYNLYNVVMNGGTLRSGTASDSYITIKEKELGAMGWITLTADSTAYLRSDLLFSGADDKPVDLGGYVFTVDAPINDKLVYWRKDVTNGTMRLKGVKCEKQYFQVLTRLGGGTPIEARTVDFIDEMGIDMQTEMNVRGYNPTRTWDNANCTGTAALNVYGTFRPDSDYFYGCTMQDGSKIDLSGKTSAWSITSQASQGRNTVDFAPDAEITVILPNRLGKIIAWTETPTGVTFKCEGGVKNGRFVVQDDGLYFTRGLILVLH